VSHTRKVAKLIGGTLATGIFAILVVIAATFAREELNFETEEEKQL
jgi:hypothetical protein